MVPVTHLTPSEDGLLKRSLMEPSTTTENPQELQTLHFLEPLWTIRTPTQTTGHAGEELKPSFNGSKLASYTDPSWVLWKPLKVC